MAVVVVVVVMAGVVCLSVCGGNPSPSTCTAVRKDREAQGQGSRC